MSEQQSLPVQEIAALLWRRRALIAIVFAVGLTTVAVLAWLQPPTYRASAKLMVTSARAHIAVSPDANDRPRVDPVTESDLNSEVAMLSSTALLREVLEPYRDQLVPPQPTVLGRIVTVLSYPLGVPNSIYRAIHGLPPGSMLDDWVEDASKHLTVAEVGRSDLIEVAYENRRPEWAAELVNNLVSHHVERHVRLNQQASAQQFYESQRELLTGKLHEAETALRSFYEREGIDSTSTGLSALRDRVSQLATALADAETELAESSAEADFLGHALTVLPKGGSAPAAAVGAAAPTSSVGLIRNRIVELQLQRSQLLAQYAPTSMKVSDLDRQIAEAHRLLEQEKQGAPSTSDPTLQTLTGNLTQTQARTAALQARTASLRAQLDSSRTQLAHLDSITSEQERLEQEVNTAKQSLATYVKKEEEARFSDALDESRIVNVAIVDRAAVPETPEKSKRTATIMLGAVMSLAAGLGLAFVRDRLDPSVKSGSEARRISGLPVLAEIPS
jgi:uncharacterized protein involved in exopolysaccharide biosynthesis